MKTKPTSCGGADTCTSSIAELPRYYPRQLITPDDLTLEQDYFRDRMRRHNRLLHGWGVVCGALVCPIVTQNADGTSSVTPWQVQVTRGYILGPYGDEIMLDCDRTVDLRTKGVSGITGEPSIDAPDPWCSQVYTQPLVDTTLYIAIKYKQSMTRPVRIQPVGCGCEDTSCEYSRWHDGYDIGVLPQCPPCHQEDPAHPLPRTNQLGTGSMPSCPDCSCGPWVGLAAVTVTADGVITQIDNCSCRRLVLSLCDFWWRCADTPSISAQGIGQFELKKADDQQQFMFNLKAPNHEVIFTSELYQEKESALHGIKSVRANAPHDGRYKRKMSTPKDRSKKREPYFVLTAENGEVIGTSEMYSSASARDHGIEAIKRYASAAQVQDLTMHGAGSVGTTKR